MDAILEEVDDSDDAMRAYSEALEAMRSQVVYVPSKNAYGRASLYSKEDLIASAEHDHKALLEHMSKGVKKAVKLEKKLVVVLGGYAVSARPETGSPLARYKETNVISSAFFPPLCLSHSLRSKRPRA